MRGCGRKVGPKIGGKWEVGLKNSWEEGLAGGGLLKLVGSGKLAPKTGGRWEIGPKTRWKMGG